MSVRFLHTSDWHLGHQLHGHDRAAEHRAFLNWLLDRAEADAVDALLVAGDIYQTSNPPAAAEQLFYDFLAEARSRLPDMAIAIIAGNHDSAPRLIAARAMYKHLGVHVVGAAPFTRDAGDALQRVQTASGDFWIGAVPFIRPSDLRPSVLREHGPAAATAERYASVYEAYAARAKADEPLVWMGHAHIRGGRPTDSERDLVRGAEEALPPSIFGDSFAYAALGHLHLAQEVEGADGPIRYAGSPIPLSLAETTYPHQVLRVDLEDGRARVASLLVPRHVDLIRFGQDDPKGPDETLAALQAEAFDGSLPRERWPFIEVSVFLEEPAVDLAERILGVLANKPVRFLRIDSRRAASMRTRLGDRVFDRDLSDLDPEEVLTEFHRAERGAEPSEALLQAFRELQAGVLACES